MLAGSTVTHASPALTPRSTTRLSALNRGPRELTAKPLSSWGFSLSREYALGLDPFLQDHQRVQQVLGPRRAAGDVDVDRNDLVHALQERVVVEHAPGRGAGAHRDHPFRLGHLVVDDAQDRRHLLGDAAGDDHEVRLAGRRAHRLRPEPRDVDARGRGRDHLDGAAGEAEMRWPHRVAAAPPDHLAERRREHVLSEGLGQFLYSQSRPPLRQMCARATSRMPMNTPISIRPNQPSWCISTAHGEKKIASTSKMMNNIAVR